MVYRRDETAPGREMLPRLLAACGLDPERDVVAVELEGDRSAASAISRLPVRRVVAFGFTPRQLGAAWTARPNAWVPDGGKDWCFAERLDAIAADQERKKRLWSALKVLKDPAADAA